MAEKQAAVIFSEQGFKMFLDFIEGVSGHRLSPGNGPNLDFLVNPDELPLEDEKDALDGQMSLDDEEFFKGYEAFKKGDPIPETKKNKKSKYNRDYSNEIFELTKFLFGKGPIHLMEIANFMIENGFWVKDPKQSSSQLRDLRRRCDRIQRVRKGYYELVESEGQE